MCQKTLVKMLVGTLLVSGMWGLLQLRTGAQQKAKNPEEGKKGATIGLLVSKGDNFIEVKGDGEEKARKFVPQWRGGAPADGGGPDKAMVKTFRELKVGSRIEVNWVFEERLRALHVKVLRAPKGEHDDHAAQHKDKKGAEERKGTTAGVLVAKQDKFIEVKGDGEEKARKYWLNPKLAEKAKLAVREAALGSRVSIEWVFTAHGPMVHGFEVIAKSRKE